MKDKRELQKRQPELNTKSRRTERCACFLLVLSHYPLSGRVTVTLVPSPSLLVSETVPWW